MDRMQLMKLHALLAAFIFPVALMFMTTGALYTWGVKGSYINEVHDIALVQPLEANVTALTAVTQAELDKLAVGYPEGRPKLKQYGDYFFLEWTGSAKDVLLEPTEKALHAKLTVKNTSWYRNLVQLHKAKGGTAFKIYAVILALSITILLMSGFMMAWQIPKLKRLTIITALLGLTSFLVVVSVS